MKKIVMIFAAMAAVLSSCQKSELESVSANDGKDIVLNISVSNPGADTKAIIKSAWAENDEISIWYDSNVQENPDLVVKYDGAKWIQKEGATVSGNTPSEGDNKYAKALYNGTVKVASKDNYTYDGTTLTFNIANWKFLTEVQVVVKELTSASSGNYTLACDKFTPLASTGNGYTVGSDAITASAGTKGAAVTGISNTDGVAFVFATADYSSSATDKKDFAFTLKDNTSGSEVTKVYKPNVAIEAKTNNAAIKALTIESSKFTAPGPDYVVMKMKSDQSEELKWATMNLGADKVATSYADCAGDYYQWGSVETLYNEIPWNSLSGGSLTITSWKTGKTDGFVESNNPYYSSSAYTKYTDTDGKTVLEAMDDAVAKAYPGTNWRMPTPQDFQDLYDACLDGSYNTTTNPSGASASVGKGVYWCTSYDGVAGCLFCDGTNKLFFPAAGCGYETGLDIAGDSGLYWSSSRYTDDADYTFTLDFDSLGVDPQDGDARYGGLSVRPVSD